MYNLRLFRINNTKLCFINQPQVRSYLSKTFLSLKSTPTRVSRLARDVQTFTASKNPLSILRTGVFEKNGKIFAKENSRYFGTTKLSQVDHLHVNTDVINNVYLYKCERPLFFKAMTISVVLQFFVWSAVAYSLWMLLPERDRNETSITEYIRKNGINMGIAIVPGIAAIGGSFLLWTFIARSIKYLILNKGGKSATLITYHPLNKNIITVPLEHIKCKLARKDMKHYMPLKLYGRRFYYILDKKGEFINPTLFDYTVGARRSKSSFIWK